MTVVLDSWAILRLVDGTEPVASVVDDVIAHQQPVMSWINVGEVYYVTRRVAGPDAAGLIVRELRAVLELDIPSDSLILAAAGIKADHPMAYADAFAAATAMAHDATLWTGDPELLVQGAPWRWHDLRVS